MTDFAELVLAADTTQLAKGEAALRSLAKTGAQTEARVVKTGQVISGAFRPVQPSVDAANRALQSLIDKQTGVDRAAQSASQSTADWAAELNREAAAFDTLRASIDPAFAASKRFEAVQEQVNAAVRSGIVSQAEAAHVMGMARAKYMGVGDAATKLGRGFTMPTNSARMLGQQLSQVAQQGAMTGNYLGALAVQLPDMALGFGNLAIAASIVATVAMPLIISAFGNGKTAAENMADANGRLGESLGRLRSMADQSLSDIADMYGVVNGQVLELLATLRKAEIEAANKAAASAVAAIADEYEVASGAINMFRITGKGAAKDVADEMGLTKDQFLAFQAAIDNFRDAKTFQEQADALQVINRYLQTSTLSTSDMAQEAAKAWDAIQKLTVEAPQSGWLSGAIYDAQKLGDTLKKAVSAEFAAPQGGGLTGWLVSAAGATDRLVAKMVNAAIEAGNISRNGAPITGQLNSATGSAYGLANALSVAAGYMSSLRSMIDGISFSNIAMAATNTALLAGETQAAATAAGQLAEQRAKLAPMLGSQDAILRGQAQAELATYEAALKTNVALQEQHAALVKAAAAAASAGAAGGAAGKATSDAMMAAAAAAEAAEAAAKDYADTLKGYVADGVDSIVNEMVSGFAGGAKSIWRILTDTIKRMVAFAIANPIKIALGLSPAMVAGQAAAGVPQTGILGSIGTAIGGIGSAFGSGMSAVWGAISSGGLSSGLSAVGSALGGITSGLSGFATALGAIALPVAALGAVFSFFKTKTKLLDSGLRVTVDGMDALVESFKRVEKSRFWGLSKSRRTTYREADADIADPIGRAIRDMETGIIDAADVLGIGSDAFADFAYQLKLSTKGMSDDEALQALQDKLAEMGDAFAGMVPGLADLQKEGEGAMDAITRLSKSLTTVNGMADTLGLAFRAVGLAGADMASQLADAFGGLDALSSATDAYYQAFYSEAERNATAIRQATSALEALGGAMPRTRDEYRAMVAGLDLTTEAGRKLFAALVGMSGVMDQVLPKIASFSAAAAALADTAQTGLAAMLDAVQSAQTEATGAANGWRDVAKGLRDFIADLRGAASEIVTPLQALAYNQTRFADTLARALGGNREAAGNLTGAADALLVSVADTARTGAEAAIAQARVLADLGRAAGVADTTAVGLDTVAGLLGEQIGILGEIRDYLTAGGDAAGLQALLDRLTASQAGLGAVVAGSLGAALAEVHLPLEAPITALNGTLAALVAQLQADAAERAAERTPAAAQNAANNATPPAQVPATTPTENPGPTLNDLAQTMGGGHGSDIPLSSVSGLLGGLLGNVRAFAKGGDHSGGLRIVGENGPELEATGASRIWNADQTRQIMGGDAAGLQALIDRPTASQAGIGAMVAGSLGEALADVHLPLEAPTAALNGTIVALVAQLQTDAAERAAVRTQEAVQDAVNSAAPPAQVPAQAPVTPAAPGPTLDDLARVIGGHGSDIPLSAVSGLLGNVRAFAKGGDHPGGLRIVGENGPELEATGASRIWTADQTRQIVDRAMFSPANAPTAPMQAVNPVPVQTAKHQVDNGDVVRELRALRKEVSDLRDQQRQIDTQILNDNRRMRKITEDWDANGMPAVRA